MISRVLAPLTAILLAFTASAAASFAVAAARDAANFPNKPVRIVVPAPPGGTIDPISRMLADGLEKIYGENFIIDNRPGANFNVGMALVAKSDPDGYTLVVASSGALATNIHLYSKLPYHPIKDFEPIILYGNVP